MEQITELTLFENCYTTGFRVFCGPHAASDVMLKLCAALAVKGTVDVLDFGNRCDMYFTARELRLLTRDPVCAMQNIHLRRAFTCYQAQSLLDQCSAASETPLLILDFLTPWLDENIRQTEAERLFCTSLYHITALTRSCPVFISIKPIPRIASDRAGLLLRLREAADEFHQILPEAAETIPLPDADDRQMTLF